MTASPPRRTRVAILISGAGSNMAALIEASRRPDSPFEVALVLSNRPTAGGLAVAAVQGVPTVVVNHRLHGDNREAHERAIDAALMEHAIDVVVLAGYMRLLTPFLVRLWAARMINIHPSLLPKYPGLNTHARAIEAGDTEAGCTVHLVTEGVDEGPILDQETVPILPMDTVS
ncbi:MAG: phosphoribosylglycinamide formyltransferase [Brevundimonas sp.]|nr:MAG: phosphoribosylglycinamide formyltransferase [Brevundimonas sp.]